MTINDYQKLAARTLSQHEHGHDLALAALGLAGEAGEVADIVKKHLYHGHELDRDEMIKELGDIAWYLAAACTILDVPMEEICQKNLEKLRRRYPNGFSSEDSINRRE